MSYAVRAFAELAGVTVKTLHHYERHGLLAPKRSRAGYRRYTVRDLGQLEAIIALKSLGLSLRQIAALVDDRARDARVKASGLRSRAIKESFGPAGALRAHREQLLQKRRRLDEALAALNAVERDGDPASALRRFVANASWTKWEAKRKTMASTVPRAPDRASASRLALFREIDAALDRDPSGQAARPLAARWDALLETEACGDRATKAALQNAWANRRIWPDGVRRYVASLYDAQPDAWERVAAFLDAAATRTAAR
jgi:DNA-binding transcriptional MerR regulator